MNTYFILTLGWFVGQIGYAAVSIYIIQVKAPNVNYFEAAMAYFKKEIAGLVMALAALFIILFIVQDYIDIEITRKDLLQKETLTWKERAIMYQRSTAVVLGAFCQHLLYMAFKRGKKEIQKLDAQKELQKENDA